jgi:hypothetical protein
MTMIRRATTLMALSLLTLAMTASTAADASGKDRVSSAIGLATRFVNSMESSPSFGRGLGQGAWQAFRQSEPTDKQNSNRGFAQSPAQSEQASSRDSDSKTLPEAQEAILVKPRNRRQLGVNPNAEDPSPTPSLTVSPTPSVTQTPSSATALAASPPGLSSSPAPTLNPVGDSPLLTLPVVLGLFAVTLIALILTVLMLRRHLRKNSASES